MADSRDVFEQLFFLNNRQVFEADAASQRTTTKSGAVLSGRDRRRKLLTNKKCPQRHARRDRLCNRNNVGHNTESLKREQSPRATQSALNFVEDEHCLVLIGEGAALAEKFRRTLQNSPFTKDRLKHDRAGISVDGFTQSGNIVLRDERHIFKQRFEPFAVLLLSGE